MYDHIVLYGVTIVNHSKNDITKEDDNVENSIYHLEIGIRLCQSYTASGWLLSIDTA